MSHKIEEVSPLTNNLATDNMQAPDDGKTTVAHEFITDDDHALWTSSPQYRIFHQFGKNAFEDSLCAHILTLFNDEIQQHYVVTDVVQLHDGNYVVRLERNFSQKAFKVDVQ